MKMASSDVTTHLRTLHGHTSDVTCIRFMNNILATCSSDKSVRLWNISQSELCITESPHSPILGHKYTVNYCSFSPFGNYLVTCSTDGNIIMWNPKNGDNIATLTHPTFLAIRCLCFSPNSSFLATGGDDDTLVLWDVSTQNINKIFKGHEASVTACGFAPDSIHVISGSTNGDLMLWSVNQTREAFLTHESEAHDLGVSEIEFAPGSVEYLNNDYYLLVSCGNDHNVCLWRIYVKNQPLILRDSTLEGHEGNVMSCHFSPSGKYLASASGDKSVILWDVATRTIIQKLCGHTRYVTCCAFSLDSQLLATGSNDKTVVIWKLPFNKSGSSSSKRNENSSIYETILDSTIISDFPEEYFCPITHDVMKDPVIAADGFSYERQAITEWIQDRKMLTSPMTNKILSHQQLIPNYTLKMLIQRSLPNK